MARNGAGEMSLVYDWDEDSANDIPIQSDRMQGQERDIANEITNSIPRDGQAPPTANLPMGGFKHTGAAVATAGTDYLRASQLQDNDLVTFTASGTDTYAITPSPVITAYSQGQTWQVVFTNGNTGAVTLNVSGLGAKAVTKRGTLPLVAGDIPAGALVGLTYDGAQFQIQNVAVEPDYFTASGTDTYAVTASPVLTAYAQGRSFSVLFTNANTGAATVNFNGLGAKAITKTGSVPLGAGDIAAGTVVTLTYDGTRFQTGLPVANTSLGLAAGATQTGSFSAASNTKYPCPLTADTTITGPASASVGDVIAFAISGGFTVSFDPNGLKANASTAVANLGNDNRVLFIEYTSAGDGWTYADANSIGRRNFSEVYC